MTYPGIGVTREWRWRLWGTRETDPEALRHPYLTHVRKPLSDAIRIVAGTREQNHDGHAIDRLDWPAEAAARLAAAHQQSLADLAALHRLEADLGDTAQERLAPVQDWLTRQQQDVKRLHAWSETPSQELSSAGQAARRDEVLAWMTRQPPRELWAQQFELHRDRGMARGYAVLISDNARKIFRTVRAPGEPVTTIRWEMARRESESMQLAILPDFRPLTGVNIVAGDLVGPNGATIPSTAWHFHEIGDIAPPPGLNVHYGMPEDTRWPDPLLPVDGPLGIPPDRLLPLLATLQVSADTQAGEYHGQIAVQANACRETQLTVSVRVFDFSLPERRTLPWDSWYDQDNLIRYYESRGATTFTYVNLENYQANLEMLGRHRAASGLYGMTYANRLDWLEIWREEDGSLTFDFSGINRWLAASQRHGNFWNLNLSCGAGWRNRFEPSRLGKHIGNLVRDRQTNALLTMDDFPERSAIAPEFSLLYERFMLAWLDNLRQHGWLDNAWHEGWDEPVGARAEAAKIGHAYLQKLTPDIKLFNYGMRPVTDDWGWGLVHAWAPNLHAWYRELPGIERARHEGIKVFAYTCGAQRHPLPDQRFMPPDINIWDPNIQRRVYGWLAHQKQLDHLYIFMMNHWPAANHQFSRDPATRWPQTDWIVPSRNTFWLVWPGPDGRMLPSLRLDALRDGFEDYEYLHAAALLHEKRPDPVLAKLLDVSDLVQRIDLYALDNASYAARKSALGDFIEKHAHEE